MVRAACDPPSAWKAAARAPDKALLRQALAPGLHVLLAEDRGTHLRYVTRGDASRLGLSPGELFLAARRHLDPRAGLEPVEPGLWAVRSPDGLAPSRLLLPGFLEAFEAEVGGPPIAAAPHAGVLWIAAERHAGRLLEAARRAWETEGTPLSPEVYAVQEGSLVPWRHPDHAPALRWAQRAHLARVYQRVAEALADVYESPRFAPVRLVESPEGAALVSQLDLTGEPTLVPQCDLLELGVVGGWPRRLPAQALAEAEGWTTWPGMDPPWWWVQEPPTSALA